VNPTAPPAPSLQYAAVGSRYFGILLAIMGTIVILSGIGAVKGVQFGPIITDGGFFLFPFAYILGDVISEVYGFKMARKAVFTCFGLSIFASLCYWVIIMLPALLIMGGGSFLAMLRGGGDLASIAALGLTFVLAMLALGMGNGAVFQLVPQRFRREIGVMTGLVGMAGGVGGFYLASSLGYSKQLTGSYQTGFVVFGVLALFAPVGLTAVKTRWRTTWGAAHLTAAKI